MPHWTLARAQALYQLPFMELLYQAQTIHRAHHDPQQIQISTLLSIKTGACPEDCKYCPQSARYHTGVAREALLKIDEITAAAERARYAADLAAHLPDGRLDWTILGIGEDGHTASLFPGATDYATIASVAVAEHPTSGQTRLTLTAPLIARSKHISYLAVGAGKADILRAIADGGDYPAARIHAEHGNTEYHTDRAAAARLP